MRIKSYEVVARIGVGARSAIYKVRNVRTGKVRALKYVSAPTPEDRKYLRHLDNEYEVLTALHDDPYLDPHPTIVVAYRMGKVRNLFRITAKYLELEFCPGKNLVQYNDYTVPEIVRIFTQVAEAMEYVHQSGFAHCDLKPENIVVDQRLQVKIVDFGFSCPLHTRLSSIKGTREYIAPEQIAGGLMTERTDIYNFGASLYRVLAGKPLPLLIPSDKEERGIFIAGPAVRPDPLHEIRPDVPRALCDIVMQCCERKPENRPARMRDVAAALQAAPVVHVGAN
jgi:serine/threonine-protein kinase